MGQMIHIDDANYLQHVSHVGLDGKQRMTGLKPRNYGTHPLGCYASIPPGTSIPLMTDEQIQAAIVRKNAEQSWLSDLRMVGMFGKMVPSRDQNGKGYCWFHSGVSANLLVRARDNQPYADLSAYAGACIIKGYRDEGGWGAEGIDWQQANGCPTSKTWPQQSMSKANDTPAMRAEAALYKPTGVWADMKPKDNRALATCLCNDDPVVVDFNWWSHSVCACRLVSWKPFKIWIWNSWGDTWSDNGMGELAESKASPDGQVALITVRVSG
jgi:hypothetical protein